MNICKEKYSEWKKNSPNDTTISTDFEIDEEIEEISKNKAPAPQILKFLNKLGKGNYTKTNNDYNKCTNLILKCSVNLLSSKESTINDTCKNLEYISDKKKLLANEQNIKNTILENSNNRKYLFNPNSSLNCLNLSSETGELARPLLFSSCHFVSS